MGFRKKTPINVFVLEEYIRDYKNISDKELLISGFNEGFRLRYVGPRLPVYSNNLVPAEINRFETLTKLRKEINIGKMIGPFINKPIFKKSLKIPKGQPESVYRRTDNTI